jgi:hypothetical protein
MKSTVLQSVGSLAIRPVYWLFSWFAYIAQNERMCHCSLANSFRQNNSIVAHLPIPAASTFWRLRHGYSGLKQAPQETLPYPAYSKVHERADPLTANFVMFPGDVMNPVLGINSSTPLTSIGTNNTVSPTAGLLASELSLATQGLFGNASTIVDLSGQGQLLSAAVAFQTQLNALQPGTATSGGGQNFGTDFASLAAEVQSFVDAFNGLQNVIASINSTGNLLGTSVTGASGLVQSFNAQAQANFGNGNSTLTNLAQLGIEFHPSPIPGAGGSLSVNLSTLQSAFNTSATGAFSLLTTATNAFNNLVGNFITQAGSSAAQAQTSIGAEVLANSLFSQAQGNGDLSTLLAIESLTGVSNLQQVIITMNEYNLVSGLLG